MKATKVFLIFISSFLVFPLFSLLILSLSNNNGNFFKWYVEIIQNEKFLSSFLNSLLISVVVGVITLFVSTYLSLSYFEKRKLKIVALTVIVFGLMPPDIIAIGINKLAQFVGVYRSNMFFLVIGLLLYCLPFAIIILWTRYYFIDLNIIKASEDLGLSKKSIVFKILIPLSKSALISVLMFSFLLTFNEYSRTFYLSGSTEYLSEYFNGKLSSGTNNSIYAGANISILITCLMIGFYWVYNKIMSKKIVY